MLLNNPWILCGIGTLFCATGVWLVYRNVFEEGKTLFGPVIIILMGVLLIAIGTAKYFRL